MKRVWAVSVFRRDFLSPFRVGRREKKEAEGESRLPTDRGEKRRERDCGQGYQPGIIINAKFNDLNLALPGTCS